MVYHNNIMCVTKQELLAVGYEQYMIDNDIRYGKLKTVRRACRGVVALYNYAMLDPMVKNELSRQSLTIPEREVKNKTFSDSIYEDTDVRIQLGIYRTDNGKPLSPRLINRYTIEASILNAFEKKIKGIEKHRSAGASMKGFWTDAVKCVQGLDERWSDNKLPRTPRRLREKYEKFKKEDWRSLIKDYHGNDNSAKHDEYTIKVLKDIFCQSYKPTMAEVTREYNQWVRGEIDIATADYKETGEIYNRSEQVELDENTVRNILLKLDLKASTLSKRSRDKIKYNATMRPYMDRVFDHAGSLISMDDRDIPYKIQGTRERLKAYLTMDTLSEVFIGQAFSMQKDMKLVMNCFANTIHQLRDYGVNMPAEVLVEHHLMNTLTETILKPGNLFRYVRFAQPGNPQDKPIERAFRRQRYSIEKRREGWIPRFYALSEANQGRIEDDIKKEYSIDEVISLCEEDIVIWNNKLHPDQNRFKGMTRLQVWQSMQHKELMPINMCDVARWIGTARETSMSRMELKVNRQKYVVNNIADAVRIGDKQSCIAYFFAEKDGSVNDVYIYKNNEYICVATPKPIIHGARIEQTETDRVLMDDHFASVGRFDKMVKEGKESIEKVVIIDNKKTKIAVEQAEEVKIVEEQQEEWVYQPKEHKPNWAFNLY